MGNLNVYRKAVNTVEKMKSLLGAGIGATGLNASLQEAEALGKLIIIGLTIVFMVIPFLWACSDRRSRLRREHGATILSDALLEIVTAKTVADLEEIRAKYLGRRGHLRELEFNFRKVPGFIAIARQTITDAIQDRLAELKEEPQ